MNPSWQNFDISRCEDEVNIASKSLVLRVWVGNVDKFRQLIVMNVHLTGLYFLAEKLQNSMVKHPPNTVIFGMLDKFFIYISKEQADLKTLAKNVADLDLPSTLLPAVVKVDQSLVRNSYNTSSVSRIQTVLRAIKQLQGHAQRYRIQIEDRLLASQENTKRLVEQEDCRMRVSQLREELFLCTSQLLTTQEKYRMIKDAAVMKEQTLKRKVEDTTKMWDVLSEDKKEHIDRREQLVKENALLHLRRKQMLSELVTYIYPITEVKGKYFINGVRLPHAEEMQGQDEVMLSAALGNTCHLILKMSQILDLPLRHPMENRGSRSIVFDQVNPKLEKEREFPLYCKGKDKAHFKYAVYLLNKNISQIRYFFGMPTQDLRLILPNVQTLLQKIGVRMDDEKEKDQLTILKSPKAMAERVEGDSVYVTASSTTSSLAGIEALLPSPAMALSAVNGSTGNSRTPASGTTFGFKHAQNIQVKSKSESAECRTADTRIPDSADHAAKSSCNVCRNDEGEDLFKPPVDDNFFKSQNSYVEEFSSMREDESSQGVCSSLGDVLSDRDRNVHLMEILESASAGQTLLPKSFKLLNKIENEKDRESITIQDGSSTTGASGFSTKKDAAVDAMNIECSCDSSDSDSDEDWPCLVSRGMPIPSSDIEPSSNTSSPIPDSQLMKEIHDMLLMEDGER
ncbi:UV radiation resistance associated protein-like isoform X2 [Pomacea canaliculata]|nr:UV radiation resistance associated protein-like isoform X2 [Pomacea canaliculata]